MLQGGGIGSIAKGLNVQREVRPIGSKIEQQALTVLPKEGGRAGVLKSVAEVNVADAAHAVDGPLYPWRSVPVVSGLSQGVFADGSVQELETAGMHEAVLDHVAQHQLVNATRRGCKAELIFERRMADPCRSRPCELVRQMNRRVVQLGFFRPHDHCFD